MIKKESKNANRIARHKRIRKNLSGTATTPRLCVFKSNTNIYAQVIDDEKGVTLVSASSLEMKINKCDTETAKKIHLSDFELVMAIGYDKEALEILKKKPEMKVVKINTPLEEVKISVREEVKITPFGILLQDADRGDFNKDTFKVVTKKKPTSEEIEDAIFAFKIAKHSKSKAVVIAKNFKMLSIAQGQTSFADACDWVMTYACDDTKGSVMAYDGIIDTVDGVHVATTGRVSLIIQAGNSYNEKEVIKACDKYEIGMITTGITHHKN